MQSSFPLFFNLLLTQTPVSKKAEVLRSVRESSSDESDESRESSSGE